MTDDILNRPMFAQNYQIGGPVAPMGPPQGVPMGMPPGGMPPGGMPPGDMPPPEGAPNMQDEQMIAALVDMAGEMDNLEGIMNVLRGDKKSVGERRDELAEIVGPEDAEKTPDSSLTIAQFGMKEIERYNNLLAQGDAMPEGIGTLPPAEGALDMDQGALMGAGQPPMPEPQMAAGGGLMIPRYAQGGIVNALPHFQEGGEVPSWQTGLGAGVGYQGWRNIQRKRPLTYPLRAHAPILEPKRVIGTGGKPYDLLHKTGTKTQWGSPKARAKARAMVSKLGKYAKYGRFGRLIPGPLGWAVTAGFAAPHLYRYGKKKLFGAKEDDEAFEMTPSAIDQLPSDDKTKGILNDQNAKNERRSRNFIEELQNASPKEYDKMLADMTSKRFKRNMNIFNEITANDASYIKQQAYLQLAQFGLNLASSKERTLTGAIAESAKNPLAAVGALGAQAAKDKKDIQKAVALQSMQDVSAIEKEVIAGDVRKDIDASKIPDMLKITAAYQTMSAPEQTVLLKLSGKDDDFMTKVKEAIYKKTDLTPDQQVDALAGAQIINREMKSVNKGFADNWDVINSTTMKKLGMGGSKADSTEEFNNIKNYVKSQRDRGIEPVFSLTGELQGPYLFNDNSLKMKDPDADDIFIRPSLIVK